VQDINQQLYSRSAVKWWVFGKRNGVIYVYGPSVTEDKAYSLGYTVQDWDDDWFEVKGYPTEDMSKAKSIYKGEKLKESGSIGNSVVNIHGMHQSKKKNGQAKPHYYPYDKF